MAHEVEDYYDPDDYECDAATIALLIEAFAELGEEQKEVERDGI